MAWLHGDFRKKLKSGPPRERRPPYNFNSAEPNSAAKIKPDRGSTVAPLNLYDAATFSCDQRYPAAQFIKPKLLTLERLIRVLGNHFT